MVFNQLVLSNPRAAEKGIPFVLLVGARRVCAPVFCEHWCLSRPQLDRYIRRVKDGFSKVSDPAMHVQRERQKADLAITWFIQYAAEVTEKLPDCDKVLLPRLLWSDLHKMFEEDMHASGHAHCICGIDHFRNTFKKAAELSHMEMTTLKRNFMKCTDCVKLTAQVTKALKSHDAAAAERAKAARLEHYMLARSDKLHYWQQRWQVRESYQPAPLL